MTTVFGGSSKVIKCNKPTKSYSTLSAFASGAILSYPSHWKFENSINHYTFLFGGKIYKACIETDSDTKDADIQLKLIVNNMEQEVTIKKEIGKQTTLISLSKPLYVKQGDYIYIYTHFANQIVLKFCIVYILIEY